MAVCLILPSCSTLRERPPAPASAKSASAPLTEACAAFAELRAKETGKPQEPLSQLRTEAAKEHFRRADAFGFSGGLRLLQNGEVAISRAYGFADHARRIPMREDAVFDIGSVAKQFTAAAILRLEELGRLRTSDPIGKHLPDVPQDKSAITIHQLLSHQAGLRHSMVKLDRTPERDEAVRELLGTALIHPPGTRLSYSNVGYALLAAIVDRRSDDGYEAFLRDQLWLPLGMTRTGMVLPDWRKAQIADALEFNGPLPARVGEEWSESGTTWLARGAGGMSSTMVDLARWAEALRTGAMLSDSSRRKLFWPHARMGVKRPLYYGYGWSIGAARDGSCVVGHNGGGGLHYDVLTILPGHGAVVATFNTQQRSPWSVGDNFVESLNPVLAGAPLMLPEVAASKSAGRQSGDYVLPGGERIRIVAERGRLKVPMDNVAALRLFAPWPQASAEEAAALAGPASAIAALMDGISRGDYAPVLARLPASVPAEGEAEFWRSYWPRWIARMGAFEGTETIGTFRVDDGLRTLVRLRFARSATIVALVHSPGGKLFIDAIGRAFHRELYLAPAGGNRFQAFYPTTRRRIFVSFGQGRMTIENGTAATVARRAS
jgi:CubicO group peptidase (beta-lactamase class C family)